MKKIKIGIFFPKNSEALFDVSCNSTFGGASVQMYRIAKELSRYPNILTLSLIPSYNTIDFGDKEYFNLVKLYKPGSGSLRKLISFFCFMIIQRPDYIIQRGLTKESCYLASMCKIFRIKMVFMFAHDCEVEGLSQTSRILVSPFKKLLKDAYFLITQNNYQYKYLVDNYNITSQIIYSGFELGVFQKKSVSVKNVLWVARCDNWKKPELFIRLAELNPDYNFTMICPISVDEVFYEIIKNDASRVENLEFIPFVPLNEIDAYFARASVFVNTSDLEGFPQTFLQATMNAVVILSLNVNPENFITKNKCGFCCDGNFDIMNQRLHEMFTSETLFAELSLNAYNYAETYHNIRINVNRILNTLKINTIPPS